MHICMKHPNYQNLMSCKILVSISEMMDESVQTSRRDERALYSYLSFPLMWATGNQCRRLSKAIIPKLFKSISCDNGSIILYVKQCSVYCRISDVESSTQSESGEEQPQTDVWTGIKYDPRCYDLTYLRVLICRYMHNKPS